MASDSFHWQCATNFTVFSHDGLELHACGDEACGGNSNSHALQPRQPCREGTLLVGTQAQVLCDGVKHIAVAS